MCLYTLTIGTDQSHLAIRAVETVLLFAAVRSTWALVSGFSRRRLACSRWDTVPGDPAERGANQNNC